MHLVHLVDGRLLELEARDRRRRPPRAASPGGQLQECAGAAAAHLVHLVDVHLLELEARDRRRPPRAGAPGGQLQELAGAAAAHLVRTWSTSSCPGWIDQLSKPQLQAWKKPISSHPQAA
ncbi:hypothetical protein, partial [Xanthomonas campestris]|uniref:hypothetical protein n=1 Tax=Xanthomonas campestris TaxID=339 RepID=UPI002AD2134A